MGANLLPANDLNRIFNRNTNTYLYEAISLIELQAHRGYVMGALRVGRAIEGVGGDGLQI